MSFNTVIIEILDFSIITVLYNLEKTQEYFNHK